MFLACFVFSNHYAINTYLQQSSSFSVISLEVQQVQNVIPRDMWAEQLGRTLDGEKSKARITLRADGLMCCDCLTVGTDWGSVITTDRPGSVRTLHAFVPPKAVGGIICKPAHFRGLTCCGQHRRVGSCLHTWARPPMCHRASPA